MALIKLAENLCLFFVRVTGSTSYYLTLKTGGEWTCKGNKWVFDGITTTIGLLLYADMNYSNLRKKLAEKIKCIDKIDEMEIKYVAPCKPLAQPIDVKDEEDLGAFKFLNAHSHDNIWPIELYASMKKKGNKEPEVVVGCHPSRSDDEDITACLTPPPLTQTQEAEPEDVVGLHPVTDRTKSDKSNMVSDNYPTEALRNIVDCDMYELKPTICRVNKGGVQIVDLVSQSEAESEETGGREKRPSTGTKRTQECIDIESDYGEDVGRDFDWDDLEDEFEDDVEEDVEEGTVLDDTNEVKNFFIDIDEEVLQQIEAEYYRSKRLCKRQFDEPMEDDGVSGNNLEIKVGQHFNCKKDLKHRLSLMALQRRFQMGVLKSDKKLYVVRCIDPSCTFFCRGTALGSTGLFQVRKYCGQHTCGMKLKHNYHRHASSSVIADHIMSR